MKFLVMCNFYEADKFFTCNNDVELQVDYVGIFDTLNQCLKAAEDHLNAVAKDEANGRFDNKRDIESFIYDFLEGAHFVSISDTLFAEVGDMRYCYLNQYEDDDLFAKFEYFIVRVE